MSFVMQSREVCALIERLEKVCIKCKPMIKTSLVHKILTMLYILVNYCA